ncbi:MAG: Hemerythrin cation binding domain [Polyangiaceae bacterium]|nr:Hemerythrin cation binding domain [Polyangiaceae bacterium]
MFPMLRDRTPELAAVIDELADQHRRLDPLLELGDRAFAALPSVEAALGVIREIRALLEPHLATEEAHVVPVLRGASSFPGPSTESEADMYAQGFAASSTSAKLSVSWATLERNAAASRRSCAGVHRRLRRLPHLLEHRLRHDFAEASFNFPLKLDTALRSGGPYRRRALRRPASALRATRGDTRTRTRALTSGHWPVAAWPTFSKKEGVFETRDDVAVGTKFAG